MRDTCVQFSSLTNDVNRSYVQHTPLNMAHMRGKDYSLPTKQLPPEVDMGSVQPKYHHWRSNNRGRNSTLGQRVEGVRYSLAGRSLLDLTRIRGALSTGGCTIRLWAIGWS